MYIIEKFWKITSQNQPTVKIKYFLFNKESKLFIVSGPLNWAFYSKNLKYRRQVRMYCDWNAFVWILLTMKGIQGII